MAARAAGFLWHWNVKYQLLTSWQIVKQGEQHQRQRKWNKEEDMAITQRPRDNGRGKGVFPV